MHNILVAQSGGPTTAINATLAGVIQEALTCDMADQVYGGLYGIQGIIEERIVDLRLHIKHSKDLEILSQTPSSALGSCRFKLKSPEEDAEQYQKLLDIFKKYEITYFIYIGGNDSMDTVDKISQYLTLKNVKDIKVLGVPKTIDNDLVETDHCPGFGSAAKYIATTIAELERDVTVYNSFGVTIVEIMGRNAGWLTASAALARINGENGPDFIYVSEIPFSTENFLRDIKSKQSQNKHLLIAVSEGLKDQNGEYLSSDEADPSLDGFEHANIAGTAKVLEEIVRKELGCKVRSIELNLSQRCAAHLCSKNDLTESRMLGRKAVQCAVSGITGEMVTLLRKSSDPYEITFASVPVKQVANKEKTIPRDWINEAGNDVDIKMMDYLYPLIQGEADVSYENGIPHYLVIR